MGLDMYLEKRTYIGAQYEYNKISGKISLKKDGKKINIKENRVNSITERIGYWRKANAIHKWFVDNIQDEEDDCRDYQVSIEQLLELKKECENSLIVEKDEDILQTTSGFFFGSTEYDEYYFEQLKYTIELINDIISEHDEEDYTVSYIYHSSW